MPRTKEFDVALVAYLPGLRKRAHFMTRDSNRAEELMQDTIAEMLEKHEECRVETFKAWAQIIMLRVLSRQAELARAKKRTPVPVGESTVQPTQYDYMDLSDTLRRLSRIPNGEVLLLRAMGHGQKEIGALNGTRKQNIHTKEMRAREVLRRRMGRASV